MPAYILAIDQGTTSSRAIIFNEKAESLSSHQIELAQFFPQDGWVEQDPEEIWQHTVKCCQEVMRKIHLTAKDITAIGISNQRETTIVWDKVTGQPIYPAIVWQDRRTAALCKELDAHPHSKIWQDKTGLLLDPYFSATKLLWILENVPNARNRAEKGELLFGTVDTFLLWRLTQGKNHATDATNASRTMLFNIRMQVWDEEILKALNIPPTLLPTVYDSAADFGVTNIFGDAIAITGIAGDQQAATIGQACFETGMIKTTLGTGCFMLLNTGENILTSHNRLLSTVAYRLAGKVTYGLEGSIFSAGTTIKWLRDTLKVINSSAESDKIAESLTDTNGVYLIPAFTGLGAPYWNPEARAAIVGLTLNSNMHHIIRAALEAICYQSSDLLECMYQDGVGHLKMLRTDGGLAISNWVLQFLADILGMPVQRPQCIETSALGAAFLAGLQSGVYSSLQEISQLWQASATFVPAMAKDKRDHLYQGWKKAVARVILNPA